MFCPQCGTSQSEDLKFCKSCGANLYAVRQVVTTRDTSEKFDWSKTWVAEMFLSEEEKTKRKWGNKADLYAEQLRSKEIKGGVITSFVGLGVMILLYVLMQGIILSGQIKPGEAEILSRLWVAGVIPFLVGLALIINGVFVSKKFIDIAKQQLQAKETTNRLAPPKESYGELRPVPPNWTDSDAATPSVTEHTTRQLSNSRQTE